MGITEILRKIWPFSASKMKSSESFSKQPTQLIVELNSSLRQIIDSFVFCWSAVLILVSLRNLIFRFETLSKSSGSELKTRFQNPEFLMDLVKKWKCSDSAKILWMYTKSEKIALCHFVPIDLNIHFNSTELKIVLLIPNLL